MEWTLCSLTSSHDGCEGLKGFKDATSRRQGFSNWDWGSSLALHNQIVYAVGEIESSWIVRFLTRRRSCVVEAGCLDLLSYLMHHWPQYCTVPKVL